MVNTGKPSRGCYMCRARRIKCDEGKPHCMRCQKSKRECPGYREAHELKLRDQSKPTKKKSNGRYNEQHSSLQGANENGQPRSGPNIGITGVHSRNFSSSSISSQKSSHNQYQDVLHAHSHSVVIQHLTTPIQQQAACYFLSNFVLVPLAGTMRGYLDFALTLMRPQTIQTSLSYAFAAVTLAAIGTRPDSKALASTADLWYLKALKEINVALQDPRTASSDATLASVMLMASFEQLAPSRITIAGWSSHVDGAVAVIKSCPIERWRTGTGRDVFIAVRAHHTLQCIANSTAVSAEVDWLGVDDYDNIIHSFASINLKMSILRADNDKTTSLKTHTPENIDKVLKLLRRAESLDQEYIGWIDALPATWAIKTVAWVNLEVLNLANSVIHPGRIDAYGELWMAYKYNIVRACRLLTWTVILRCVAWLAPSQDYRLTPEYATASGICQQILGDIVSSVPYFFGWNRNKDTAMVDKSTFACGANDYITVKPLAGMFVMWPLFIAATSDFASPTQRIFLRGRLKFVAEMMGINQASVMLQIQLFHPSLYIARERMNLVASPCHAQFKTVAGSPSTSPAIPDMRSQPSTHPESMKTQDQNRAPKPATLSRTVWQAPPLSTRQELWSMRTSPPRIDQSWQEPPLQIQAPTSKPKSPPREQIWSASITSPPREMWRTPSSPPGQNHLWSSTTDSYPENWTAVPDTGPNNHNNVYELPMSRNEDVSLHKPSSTTALSPNGTLISLHDSAQVWAAEFEESPANWVPRNTPDRLDMLTGTHGSHQS